MAKNANPDLSHDQEYFDILADAIRVCGEYNPKFGQGGEGLTLQQFEVLYGADPFYNWLGLNSPMMYAAHKAAGGMTSIYRQVGMGGQWIFNRVLQHTLGLTESQASWTYKIPNATGGTRSLSLDGRIDLANVQNAARRNRVRRWIEDGLRKLVVDPSVQSAPKKGVVFEVRQGYKSKDSKRQNADIANAAHAYVEGYMPAVVVLSTQIDGDLVVRYTQARWLLLTGTNGGTPTDSTYAFCRDILGYDLAGFFERNSARFRAELEKVLTTLLKSDGN
jgi:RNase P protein component